MNEIARIVDQLEREHAGDPWHGSPLSAILEGISWEQAAARPIAGAHSIWELVLHLAAWKNEVRHRLSGEPAGEPEEGDWPAVQNVGPKDWKDAHEKLELAHRLLVSAVKDFPEQNLYIPLNDAREQVPGAGTSYYELLHGIVQHDVYHAGQIAVLKKSFA
jgi:uncharacterized damage-inducible protein DinB